MLNWFSVYLKLLVLDNNGADVCSLLFWNTGA